MKGDDDTFVRIDAIINEAKKVPENKSLYIGNINYYHKPLRSGKWAVTYEVLLKDLLLYIASSAITFLLFLDTYYSIYPGSRLAYLSYGLVRLKLSELELFLPIHPITKVNDLLVFKTSFGQTITLSYIT